MNRKSSRAFSLLEVVMTGAILALFMAMVAEALVRMHKAHNLTSQKLTNLRAASTMMENLGRELRSCDGFYHPDPTTVLATYHPIDLSSTPVVFRYNVSTGYRVVGYKLDATRGKVTRMVYAQDYDPTVVASQVVQSHRDFLEDAEHLNLSQIDENNTNGLFFVHYELKLTTERDFLSSDVRVRGL